MSKRKDIVSYEDSKCLICELVIVKTNLISMRVRQFCLCDACAKELKERLK